MDLYKRVLLVATITMLLPALGAAAGMKVVVGKSSPEPVRFAAAELSRYITEASGVPVAVVETTKTQSDLAVVLLNQAEPIPDLLSMPVSRNEEAYYIYSQENGRRVFTGRSPRAVVYAVYDFLETELGYRWYFPAAEDVVPPTLSPEKMAALLRHKVDREVVPAFPFREREFRDVQPMTEQTDQRIVEQIDWWAKLRMNRFLLNFGYASDAELWARWKAVLIPEIKKRGMLVGLGEHGSYPMFLPAARYAADHPDWYCEIDGTRATDMAGKQFCTTNPQAVKTYLENFEAFIRENPEVDFYYPAPNDVSKWCECTQCSPHSIADRYMLLDNQVAEMLQRVKPGTRVMHLAYSNHRLPPENVIPHPMIDVDVACWGRDFAYPLNDQRTMPENKDYLEVFRQWADVCRSVPGDLRPQLIYHSKLMRHYWLGLHLQPLSILDEDFKAAQDLQLDGFDFPLGFVGIWTKGLNSYVVAQKCWTPDTPAAFWVDRFFSDYYQEHSVEARKIYELVEDAFQDRRYGSSLGLAWHPQMISLGANPRTGLGENARNALRKLNEALSIAAPYTMGENVTADRFKKLSTVLKNARDEQQVLVKLDALARAYNNYQNSPLEDQEPYTTAHKAWRDTMAENAALKANYRAEDDLAGLYWAGATHITMADALREWGEAIADYDWFEVGTWETGDFPDKNTVVMKEIDSTSHITGMKSTFPQRIQVKFVYGSGELGATSKAVMLSRHNADGSVTPLSEDRHSGFAGYVHNNASYQLRLDTAPDAAARYILQVELMAYATTKGSVAERGCNGTILLGVPKNSLNN